MNTTIKSRKVGEIRPSQFLFTFGVGALIDLPHLSVIVTGLDRWNTQMAVTVPEERLLALVRKRLGHQVGQLLSPPIPEESDGPPVPLKESNFTGIPVSVFPEWMLCTHCRSLIPVSSGLLDFKSDAVRVDKNRYVHKNCNAKKPPQVVPVRFLVACKKGHLDDFPWVEFVHTRHHDCQGRLKFKERGTDAGGIDLYVECEECGDIRNMVEVFSKDKSNTVLGKCKGKHPHLKIEENCDEPLTSLVLGASNSWFPLLLSVLSVPTSDDELVEMINKYWQNYFYDVDRPEVIKFVLKTEALKRLNKYTTDEIWHAIEWKRNNLSGSNEEISDIKGPEWKLLTNPSSVVNNKDLQLKEVNPPERYKKYFSRVVLVERLREVRALIGFTRVEAPGDLSDSDEFNYDNVAPLSRAKPAWVPAVEIRGEGIFIQFDEKVIQDWLNLESVKKRDQEFLFSHIKWREVRKIEPKEEGYPAIRYILLHTFAHALMRQLSIECGYSSASIRERIYSLTEDDPRGPRAGILIYTSTPDSEGTLGGLVSLGNPGTLGRHIEDALESARLCSSDPICSEHSPGQDGKTLHGSACHACLFSPEPSCERGNKYLDRALLTDTMNSECDDIWFFRD
ncbi:MAG TPA: DUF1998 domain-containing protein [Candidatus Eremiobacteraeota bacterium]|nr:DUF1998 domain-containing protein [Candidatus Eremiobacteraeota bacterium]